KLYSPISRLEDFFNVIQLPFRFLDRRAGTSIFAFEQTNNRISIVSDERQAILDRRVAGAQLDIGTLVFLAIFNMDVCDAIVMLSKKRGCIVVSSRVMTDVEVNDEGFRDTQKLLHAFGRRYLVGIFYRRMGMPRRSDFVLLGVKRNPRTHSDSRLIRR